MIVCPNCQHHEIDGALFCSECATMLVDQTGVSTISIQTDPKGKQKTGSYSTDSPLPLIAMDSPISLHVIRTGQILPLVGREEFTIGRVSEGQSILPDIDLTPYDAYTQGVSRLHMTVKITGAQIFITDLGSSNGTRINDKKLKPHAETPVQHGDILGLGQFKIQALIRKE